MPDTAALDRSILETALTALESRKEELDRMIANARHGLGKRTAAARQTPKRWAAAGATKVKRVLSPEARKRIAEAQKKRWAAARKAE